VSCPKTVLTKYNLYYISPHRGIVSKLIQARIVSYRIQARIVYLRLSLQQTSYHQVAQSQSPPPVPTPVAAAPWQQQQWAAPPPAPAPVVTYDHAPRYDQQPTQCWQQAAMVTAAGYTVEDDDEERDLDELLALCIAN
jgi:hypothetical protein